MASLSDENKMIKRSIQLLQEFFVQKLFYEFSVYDFSVYEFSARPVKMTKKIIL